ncbi:hypothetical protein CQZ99_18105 [Pseudomonas poae]|uniref:Uncharacterized protein n=1 Tax=Pseudomonas poae TaxID=200451 RepID=A0A2S9EJD4_9PSED|nr:hypothetical protein CQZ97_21540 [Pseudomonas poae]PRC15422.1 hypothetical protein CQZ99_18105 [Pseudomonas poae]
MTFFLISRSTFAALEHANNSYWSRAGCGLGLSIVQAIAARTGARVELAFSDPVRQRGLCVCVCIPAPAL